MLQYSRNIKHRSSRALFTKGYSLVELMIVITLISLILSATLFQFKGSILSVSPDTVAVDLASAINKAREKASSGVADINSRTIDITKALVKPHFGVTLSSTPTTTDNGNCNSNCYPQNSICISGQNFCYVPSNTITFDRFSGYTQNPDIVFITSSNRKLALLITRSGDYYIAEQIKGVWYSKTQLQNLNQSAGGKY